MTYPNERTMYPDIAKWLRKLLQSKFADANIVVADTSRKILSRWLFEEGLHNYFPDYQTYEIEVDVTGLIEKEDTAELFFVECKYKRISLRDISQLLGYSKVANPQISLLTSPAGISESMTKLLLMSRRTDILNYSPTQSIIIGKWDGTRKEIDASSIIPRGTQI